MPGSKQACPTRRRLLVARDAQDRDLAPEQVCTRHAEVVRTVLHNWQHFHRYVEQIADGRRPRAFRDVVQHGAAGVRGVSRMNRTARQLPNDVGIDCAEQQLTLGRPLARTGVLVQNPFQLGRRKIGIKQQPGFFRDRRLVPGRHHLGAVFGCAPVLPDDCHCATARPSSCPKQPWSRAGS